MLSIRLKPIPFGVVKDRPRPDDGNTPEKPGESELEKARKALQNLFDSKPSDTYKPGENQPD
jgi:hypothetical protein